MSSCTSSRIADKLVVEVVLLAPLPVQEELLVQVQHSRLDGVQPHVAHQLVHRLEQADSG